MNAASFVTGALARAYEDVATKMLNSQNQRLADQHHQIAAGNQQLRRRITELEDNLAAARTGLRRMIRPETSRPATALFRP